MTKNGLPAVFSMHQLRQRRRALAVAVERIRNQLAHVLVGERRKDDLLHERSGVSDRIERAHQRMGGRDFVVPVGADQQHVPHIRLRQQVFEQIERGRIEPLQIVEEQGQRMLRPRRTQRGSAGRPVGSVVARPAAAAQGLAPARR